GLPVVISAVLTMRRKLGFVEPLKARYGGLGPALAMFDIALGMMIGGGLGNGLRANLLGKGVGYIPLGTRRANFAGRLPVTAMPFMFLAASFFRQAQNADRRSEPVTFSAWKFFAVPWLAVLAGLAGLPTGLAMFDALAAIGLMTGTGLVLASALLERHIRS